MTTLQGGDLSRLLISLDDAIEAGACNFLLLFPALTDLKERGLLRGIGGKQARVMRSRCQLKLKLHTGEWTTKKPGVARTCSLTNALRARS